MSHMMVEHIIVFWLLGTILSLAIVVWEREGFLDALLITLLGPLAFPVAWFMGCIDRWVWRWTKRR